MRDPVVQDIKTNPFKTVAVRNNNSSAAFLDGRPVFFDSYTSSSGYPTDAKMFNESGVTTLFAGIFRSPLTAGMAVGDIGEAICYGFTDAVAILRTRAASTDTWASIVGIAVGDQLIPVTGFSGALSRQGTLAASNYGLFQVIAAQSAVSLTTAASDSTLAMGAGTAWTARLKVFVRGM